MRRERIQEAIQTLPEIPAGKYPIEDGETFEGDEYGGHFKFTRNFMPHPLAPTDRIHFCTLSVSGPERARRQLIQDFCQVLGKPITNPEELQPGVHFVSWQGRSRYVSTTSSQPQP